MTLRHDPAQALRRIARSKINLFLHVCGRRSDGYHLLQSLAVFPDIGDVIDVRANTGALAVSVTGPFARELADVAPDDNLVARAARALAAAGRVPAAAAVAIDKRLPVAAGIGGGSADAAAALHALNELWALGMSDTDLQAIGIGIGADVPVCVASRAQVMTGIGERLAEAPVLPPLALVLVRPDARLATAQVFAAFAAARTEFGEPAAMPARLTPASDLVAFLGRTRNDLEPAARALAPAIAAAVDALATAGATVARMSGSGPTCFGLYLSDAAAGAAAASIAHDHPGWWVAATAVAASGHIQ